MIDSPEAIRTEPMLGIRANRGQFALHLLQVFFVGLTLGMMRTVVPAVAEAEFNLPRGATGLLVTFVIAFGVVKGVMNFVAGAASERLGRKHVLVIGWIIALPVPLMIGFGQAWAWIVAATILLGVNQGLSWTMALTSKLDLTRADQRGLTNGLNEFFGYVAVALAGVITAYLAEWLGPRTGLLLFGMATIMPALAIALIFVRDTRPWTRVEASARTKGVASELPSSSTLEVSAIRPLRTRRFFALCQAGLVEKFVDALMWVFLPVYLVTHGIDLAHVGWIPGIYAATWGVLQLWTGPLSDRIGRDLPIISGMFICAAGVLMMIMHVGAAWWSASAAVTGLGMALLYPNLGAAVADAATARTRATALGVYRFWRDLGYAAGALGLGLAAQFTGSMEPAFWLVGICMAVSGAAVWLLSSCASPIAQQPR